ncbi:MAG: hypothetical protein ABI413_00130, partial [Ktedonobacteraceae bacterium]
RSICIAIDGLDLLETNANGTPDLSFLPDQPPAGMVFVVGTRPNKTRDYLKMLVKLRDEYELSKLSYEDFALMLQRRPEVALGEVLSSRLYEAMQGNALYLNLVVRVLLTYADLQPAEVIARVESNPTSKSLKVQKALTSKSTAAMTWPRHYSNTIWLMSCG